MMAVPVENDAAAAAAALSNIATRTLSIPTRLLELSSSPRIAATHPWCAPTAWRSTSTPPSTARCSPRCAPPPLPTPTARDAGLLCMQQAVSARMAAKCCCGSRGYGLIQLTHLHFLLLSTPRLSNAHRAQSKCRITTSERAPKRRFLNASSPLPCLSSHIIL